MHLPHPILASLNLTPHHILISINSHPCIHLVSYHLRPSHTRSLPGTPDGTEIVEVTTSVVAGPPADLEVSSSPAGGEAEAGAVVIVTAEGDARVNGESELVSPTDNSEEHVTVVSSPGMSSITHPRTSS